MKRSVISILVVLAVLWSCAQSFGQGRGGGKGKGAGGHGGGGQSVRRAQKGRGAGLGDAPRTVLEEFAKIKSGDVVLPTRTSDGQADKTVRLRCVTTPDEAQKVLLNRLGLTLPQRLRRIDEIAQM